MDKHGTKDFFASPSLSLSLAGVFRNAAAVEEGAEEVGEEESVGISSENTGPLGDEEGNENEEEEEEEAGDNDKKTKKKRKKYHRHTVEQIREMEALFKESPHPDEKQRQQLSKQLGLSPKQVKFWFQNRRTQIKSIQERHENSVLKSEMEKLREENRGMREAIRKSCCPKCGFATAGKDAPITAEEQHLRIENARLKAEVEKLRGRSGSFPDGTVSPSATPSPTGTDIDVRAGFLGLDKSKIMEAVESAVDELTTMATAQEPLWIRSVETGREILNYDEYRRQFVSESSVKDTGIKISVEASRETGMVFLDVARLLQALTDVNQWKEMFTCMISKASMIDVVTKGDGTNSRNGSIQLMFAELQMLTPTVPTREVYFVRHCKRLSDDRWAIVDVSVDDIEEGVDTSLTKCRKRPSGCIIEDRASGHCKVVWVEHTECRKSSIPTMYRSVVSSGAVFGARRWMATLQLQCERIMFSMATNVPTKDSSGVSNLAGRRSILRLAQRMTSSFCQAVGASRHRTWTKVSTRSRDDIRFTSRKNTDDHGEPLGLILCAVSSAWLPVPSTVLFNFLRDESRRKEWDIMRSGDSLQAIVSLAKAKDRGNSVTVHATKSRESSMWILQDTCTNAYESMVVYALVDTSSMQSVLTGCDSSNVAVLPSGFAILPDGLESRSLVITSTPEEKAAEGWSLLTLAFQILANVSPQAKLTLESVENINTLVSCMLHNIKKSLQCEDE